MKGLAILFGFLGAGTIIHQATGLPLPGNVIGLALFTTALFLGWVKLEWVETSAQFLLKHMMLFCVPVIVGTIAFVSVIGANGVPIVLTLVLSTFVTMLVTGWVTQWAGGVTVRKQRKREAEREAAAPENTPVNLPNGAAAGGSAGISTHQAPAASKRTEGGAL